VIPVAGAYIGAAVGAFMILTVDPIKAVIFLVFLVILQQFEGNVIYPKVVGSSMGLPGIWVLAAVTVGGGMMGIAGMLLGVPLAAAAYRILRDDVINGEQGRRHRRGRRRPAEHQPEQPAEPAPVPVQQSGEKQKKK
jgi:predicted PurR-regulated permease PerM